MVHVFLCLTYMYSAVFFKDRYFARVKITIQHIYFYLNPLCTIQTSYRWDDVVRHGKLWTFAVMFSKHCRFSLPLFCFVLIRFVSFVCLLILLINFSFVICLVRIVMNTFQSATALGGWALSFVHDAGGIFPRPQDDPHGKNVYNVPTWTAWKVHHFM